MQYIDHDLDLYACWHHLDFPPSQQRYDEQSKFSGVSGTRQWWRFTRVHLRLPDFIEFGRYLEESLLQLPPRCKLFLFQVDHFWNEVPKCGVFCLCMREGSTGTVVYWSCLHDTLLSKYKIRIIESMLVICALQAHCTRYSYDIIKECKQLPLQAEHVEEKYQESELFPRRQASM